MTDFLTEYDRGLIQKLTSELRRKNDLSCQREVLVSCTEAARLLGKTPATISKMLFDGRLHKTTLGASTGIKLSEIQTYSQ